RDVVDRDQLRVAIARRRAFGCVHDDPMRRPRDQMRKGHRDDLVTVDDELGPLVTDLHTGRATKPRTTDEDAAHRIANPDAVIRQRVDLRSHLYSAFLV